MFTTFTFRFQKLIFGSDQQTVTAYLKAMILISESQCHFAAGLYSEFIYGYEDTIVP